MREIRKPEGHTASSQKDRNDENQFPEKLGKERKGGESRRAEERWEAIIEGEVKNEVGRRMCARETSKDMTDEVDELAGNPQQQERHKEMRGMTCTTSPRNGETCPRGVSHDTEA